MPRALSQALFVLTLASCSAVPAPQRSPARERSQMVSIYLGGRALDDDYDPVDQQGVFGLEYATGVGEPIGFEIGMQGSADDDEVGGVDVEAVVGEVYAGLRKTFVVGEARPVIGVGLSALHATVDTSFGDDDDDSLAGYAHAGVGFMLSEIVSLGFDARVLFGSDLQFGGFDADADYGQFALVLGFGI